MSAGQPWDESVRTRSKARWNTRDHLDPGSETASSALCVTTSAKSTGFLRVSSSKSFSTSLDTFSGVSLGLGMETRLDTNWGLKLEYRFTQLSDEELFSISKTEYYDHDPSYYSNPRYVVESGVSADLEPSIHTGRVLLTYRFNRAPEPIEPLK